VVASRHGKISEEALNAINGLSVLRNLATHGQVPDLNPTRALEFVHLADAVLFALANQTH
jgi:hypothetical protein